MDKILELALIGPSTNPNRFGELDVTLPSGAVFCLANRDDFMYAVRTQNGQVYETPKGYIGVVKYYAQDQFAYFVPLAGLTGSQFGGNCIKITTEAPPCEHVSDADASVASRWFRELTKEDED